MRRNKVISVVCALAMMMTMFSAFITAEAAVVTSGHKVGYKHEVTVKPTDKNDKTFTITISADGVPSDVIVASLEYYFYVDTTKFEYVSFADCTDGETMVNYDANDNVLIMQGAAAKGLKELSLATLTLKIVDPDATVDVSKYDISASVKDSSLKLVDPSDKKNATSYTSGDATNPLTNAFDEVAYESQKEASDPVITGVTVAPKTATVKPGETQKFTATVMGTDGLDKDLTTVIKFNDKVTWTAEGAGTIDAEGTLTVNSDATAGAEITVKATSVGDASKFDTATVKVGGAAVELTVAANTDVTNYTVQNISISKAADAEQTDVDAFKASVNGNKVVVLVTGKTADNVVVGSAYVIVDGADIANGIDNGSVALGSVGITGAAKCEVSLIVNGNPVL